jgi:hypothetical protein
MSEFEWKREFESWIGSEHVRVGLEASMAEFLE